MGLARFVAEQVQLVAAYLPQMPRGVWEPAIVHFVDLKAAAAAA